MKKSRNPLIAILIVIAVLGIALAINLNRLHESKTNPLPEHPSGEATSEQRPQTDYSSRENWAWFAQGKDKDADVFLVCPTVDVRDEYNMSLEDTKTKENFLGALNMERGIYEGSARLYAPYYRQAAMKVYSMDSKEREPYLELAYSDVSAAFAWYLEHENHDRPIILAGL